MAVLAPAPPGPLDSAELLALNIGGAESNVALYLAAHGVPARWISRVGDDPFGQLVQQRVAAGGVDVMGVEIDPERPTGVYFKHRAGNGNQVHYYRHGSAASAMTSAVLDSPAVRSADALHLSGITPALSDSCHELVTAALRRGGLQISFDVNWRPALWRGIADPGELLLQLARRASVVFVGLDEATAVWGCRDPAAVRALLPEPGVLVVKDSDRGATAFRGDEVVTVPALTVEVVDVVGAGDAFAAGFLAGGFTGLDLTGQLRLGHLTAAAALLVSSDHGPLLEREITDRLLAADPELWAAARITSNTTADLRAAVAGDRD
jgi:2-dehydro-3-deoxygluconokinase